MRQILKIENEKVRFESVSEEVLEEINGYIELPKLEKSSGETITLRIIDYSIKQELFFRGTSKSLNSDLSITIRADQDHLNLEDNLCMLRDIQELLDTKYAKLEKGYS